MFMFLSLLSVSNVRVVGICIEVMLWNVLIKAQNDENETFPSEAE